MLLGRTPVVELTTSKRIVKVPIPMVALEPCQQGLPQVGRPVDICTPRSGAVGSSDGPTRTTLTRSGVQHAASDELCPPCFWGYRRFSQLAIEWELLFHLLERYTSHVSHIAWGHVPEDICLLGLNPCRTEVGEMDDGEMPARMASSWYLGYPSAWRGDDRSLFELTAHVLGGEGYIACLLVLSRGTRHGERAMTHRRRRRGPA